MWWGGEIFFGGTDKKMEKNPSIQFYCEHQRVLSVRLTYFEILPDKFPAIAKSVLALRPVFFPHLRICPEVLALSLLSRTTSDRSQHANYRQDGSREEGGRSVDGWVVEGDVVDGG